MKSGNIQGMHHADKGDKFDVDLTLDDARPEDFDVLLIPGGLMNPDTLRSTEEALEFTRDFFDEGKPVAAICHAPWVLNGLVTSRKPDDIPAFTKKMIEEFCEGRHPVMAGPRPTTLET